MKNRRSGWRYSSEERKDNGKEWRVRNSNYREETSNPHRQNARREERREERATGWGSSGRIDYGPSSKAALNRRVDVKETETKGDDGWNSTVFDNNAAAGMIADGWGATVFDNNAAAGMTSDGWGTTVLDNNASADLTSAWEALTTSSLSDWSKPPQIDSVVHWDDTGAKETWESIKTGGPHVNNPDLYLENNIDWNSRIQPDLLAFVDDKGRFRKASYPRSGSPVLLGLETLAQSSENNQLQGRGDEEKSIFNQSKEKLEQRGGSGSWGDANQNAKPGQRWTKQQWNDGVSGEKQTTLMRDDYKDISRKRRGDKDEYHRKPRYRTIHRPNTEA